MFLVFYGEDDKREIKSWIKSSYSTLNGEILNLQARLQEIQLEDYSKQIFDLQNENAALRREITFLKSNADTKTLQAEVTALKNEFATLKSTDSTKTLQAEVTALKNELATLKSTDSTKTLQAEITALKNELATLKSTADTKTLQAEVTALKNELATLKSTDNTKTLQAEIQSVETKKEVAEVEGEEIFYLPTTDKVFITNNRAEIPQKIRQALQVEEIQKVLQADKSEISEKFQRLINVHLQEVQTFIKKLKLNDLDDEELSENITPKYFKLFQHIIFNNLLVAIKRGLNDGEKDFYLKLLEKINSYLASCGIYTVNAKSGEKATDEDYKNMSPQVITTSDKSKDKIITEIERLPYRINYLDEFGEKNFIQHQGVMTIYKAAI